MAAAPLTSLKVQLAVADSILWIFRILGELI
jgi:hypothetical protein